MEEMVVGEERRRVSQNTLDIVSHTTVRQSAVCTHWTAHCDSVQLFDNLHQTTRANNKADTGANNSKYTVTVFLKDSASVSFPRCSLLPTCYFLLSLTSVVKFYISAFNV